MKQVKVLLMFTAAIRNADWKLHLSTTEQLLPYFHGHDQYNYGRWDPLYVADMLEMQTADPGTWTFLDEGNFVISKHGDHAIEQEHRKIKVNGGFVCITGNEQVMEKYFIIANILDRLVHEFKEYAGIETRTASSLHHDIGSQKRKKLVSNAAKVVDVLNIQRNPYVKEDMNNLVMLAVIPDYVSNDIENRDQLGRDALRSSLQLECWTKP